MKRPIKIKEGESLHIEMPFGRMFISAACRQADNSVADIIEWREYLVASEVTTQQEKSHVLIRVKPREL